ncbi:MAG: amidohydrolase family protein [Patescibacteria group bacterium]
MIHPHADRYIWQTSRAIPRSVLLDRIPFLVTANQANQLTYQKHVSVLVEGDTITKVLPAAQAKQYRTKVDLIYDAALRGGVVVLPGFVNAHAHPPMYLLRSTTLLKDHQATTEEALVYARKVERAMTLADQTISALGDFTEQQKFGTTTVLSHYHTPIATTTAAKQAYIRLVDAISVASKTDPSASIAKAAQALRKHDPLLTHGITIHTLERMTLPELIELRRWFVKHPKLILTIHCGETQTEVEAVIQKHQMRPVEVLAKAKLLSPRLVLSHAVHFTIDEIKLLAKYQVGIAHLPTSNRLHKSGQFQYGNFQIAGLGKKLALGTDSVISKSRLDLVSEAFQSKLMHQDSQHPATFEELFLMLTNQGADVVGLGKTVGKILPGYKADMTFWKLKDRMFVPFDPMQPETLLGNFITHGGYTARDVMVNGRFVISGRRHNLVNESELLTQLEDHHQALRKRVKL